MLAGYFSALDFHCFCSQRRLPSRPPGGQRAGSEQDGLLVVPGDWDSGVCSVIPSLRRVGVRRGKSWRQRAGAAVGVGGAWPGGREVAGVRGAGWVGVEGCGGRRD